MGSGIMATLFGLYIRSARVDVRHRRTGWNNTELMPNAWLWFAFLRTGRADIFRVAEAMTRNTNEVDIYHLGRFAGLGSRHNVNHWGDGAKEARHQRGVCEALLLLPDYG